ncbi:6-carboxytetrahydropterin synthase [Hydrogenophaga sp.]|uniref:6-carboxytetrahydropterin synthase n=1 Tax=Hydrogenophaga sp. TaxID=1904254 RepID=UPI0027231F2C|nr:6-carboxytetrahydropterin synthase [Hydrogenophaga sp.]MDO9437739.1 6-carboxytetrahydropterin synthase [Hydrogenophaga sp.]
MSTPPTALHELSQRFFFEASHTLRRAVEAEGSRRVHGHTYEAEVTVRGTPDAAGMVIDLALLRAEIARVREKLDHHLLDEVADLGLPTLESLCSYIGRQLAPAVPGLCAVTIERRASGDRCALRW